MTLSAGSRFTPLTSVLPGSWLLNKWKCKGGCLFIRAGWPYNAFRSDGKHNGFTEVESKVNLNTGSRLKWSAGDSRGTGRINGKCVYVEWCGGVKLSLGCVGQMETAEWEREELAGLLIGGVHYEESVQTHSAYSLHIILACLGSEVSFFFLLQRRDCEDV